MNALYYADPRNEEIDYHIGVADLKKRRSASLAIRSSVTAR